MKMLFRLTSILITAGMLLLSNCATVAAPQTPDELGIAIRGSGDVVFDKQFLVPSLCIRH